MIKSFRCKETQKIWEGIRSSKFPIEIQDRILRKLRQLDVSDVLDDLKNPPGNNLENLKGNRHGQMSIRVNQKWRICFLWRSSGVFNVEVIDYH